MKPIVLPPPAGLDIVIYTSSRAQGIDIHILFDPQAFSCPLDYILGMHLTNGFFPSGYR